MLRRISPEEMYGLYTDMYLPYIRELKKYGGGDGMRLTFLMFNLRQRSMGAYIIEHEGAAAGFILVEYIKENLLKPMLYVMDMYVRPEFRRRGIGARAFRELLDENGTGNQIFFVVLPENRGALRFWRRQVSECSLKQVRPDARQRAFAGGTVLFCLEGR